MYRSLYRMLQVTSIANALTRPVSLLHTPTFIERNARNKFISISPGGLAGFYMLGIVTYIREHYDTSSFQIIGASAGAWNTLPMVYKGSIHDVVQDILCNYDYTENENEDEIASIYQLQQNIQHLITTHYSEDDFDLHRVNIATTGLTTTGFEQLIICDISTLRQATECCIASSHIPFITGKVPKINDKRLFDGGFQKFPPEELGDHLNITPNIWQRALNENFHEFLNIKNLKAFEKLYEKGYRDSNRNRKYLDYYLLD